MPVVDDVDEAVRRIEIWFNSRCDGTWEQNSGIELTTTDNPGWWLTISGLVVRKEILAECIGDLLRDFNAQVTTDQVALRVYAPSFRNCLCATATVLGLVVNSE